MLCANYLLCPNEGVFVPTLKEEIWVQEFVNEQKDLEILDLETKNDELDKALNIVCNDLNEAQCLLDERDSSIAHYKAEIHTLHTLLGCMHMGSMGSMGSISQIPWCGKHYAYLPAESEDCSSESWESEGEDDSLEAALEEVSEV